jgi:hypothetical protein
MTVHIEWENDRERMERCDREGTSRPMDAVHSVTECWACGKTWPTSFGVGAPTVRIVSKRDG